MVQVKFSNMEKSETAIGIAKDRISEAIARFPKGQPRMVVVTLGMENSPRQAGPDLFKVRTEVIGGRYHGMILEKSASDLYLALAEVTGRLLERFNRFSDRIRTKDLKQRRKLSSRRPL